MINSKYLIKKPSKINGMGIFTEINIPANSPIIEVKGDLFTKDNLPNHPAVLQVGHNSFLGPSGGADDYINHSCNPNCYLHIVGNRAIVYSLYVIPAGSELTFDYSTSSTDSLEEWQINCKCGAFKCRKVISGIQHLDTELIENYKSRKIIPLFLRESVFK